MHFKDSRRWRLHTTSYELPHVRQLANVSKAISFHPSNGVLGLCSDRPDRGCTGGSKARPGIPSWAGLRLFVLADRLAAKPAASALTAPKLPRDSIAAAGRQSPHGVCA
jgi:hypothetical protein